MGLLILFLFLFSIPSSQSSLEKEQVDEPGAFVNEIAPYLSIFTKTDFLNPFEILGIKAAAAEKEKEGDIELTVYNKNLALVKEKRELDLKTGINKIEYTDVAAQIEPTSVMFEDTKNKDTSVLEQNYGYDLVSSYKLLEKFKGKEIAVSDEEGNTYKGTLLNSDGELILRQADGTVLALDRASKVEFPDSADLLTKPTLTWEVYSPTAGKRDVLTSYLTGGLDWQADYIVKTNTDDTKADITGWVSLDNRAGTDYENAKLKLVAGEVHRVEPPKAEYDIGGGPEMTFGGAGAKESFSEEAFFEYHLYTLERPVTLKDRQIKQISLLSATSVPLDKELVFDSQKSNKVQVYINMENSKEKNLGMPLPAGTARVYKADSEGQLQFLGEDRIDHTPKDEEVKLVVGNSFDVTGKRTQTDYKRVSDNVRRTSYEIKLKNHKSEPQNVTVVEHFNRDWEITKTSDKYEKTDAFKAEWEIKVPAGGEKILSYTVETRY